MEIYPEIETIQIGHTFHAKTRLRKKHDDGKYYLVRIESTATTEEIAIEILHTDVHTFDILGTITPEVQMTTLIGHQLDPNQQPEEERIRQLLRIP